MMNAIRTPRLLIVGAFGLLAFGSGCTEKPTEPESFGSERPAPAQVQRIFNLNCTTSNCHGASNPGAGLQLVTWDRLILGSRYGEDIIAYRPEDSHLIDHLTGDAIPRMPLSRDPLPAADIDLIRQWIGDGAPNDLGEIPYTHSRRKIYVTNQSSDEVSVIDADALVVIRIIDVGVVADLPEAPHNVRVDDQSKYFYVSLINAAKVLKYDVETDQLVGSAIVGQSPANPVPSPDGKTLYVTNWNQQNATFHVLNAETMTEKYFLTFPPPLGDLPHGLTVTRDGLTCYTTHQGSSMVFRIELGETANDAVLTPIALGDTGLQPLQVLLDEDERHLFVTCFGTGEVRVIDLATDEVIRVIPIQGQPWLLDMTRDGRKIYVGNWGKNGVDVIDTQTLNFQSLTNPPGGDVVFAQPHGVAINDRYAFVSNENGNPGGIPEHHPDPGGNGSGRRDGAVTVIDLQTNQVRKLLTVEKFPTGISFAELP